MTSYTILQLVIISLLIGLVVFLERALPFLLFSQKEPPAIIRFIEKYIPPMVMAVLVVYCLKDMNFSSGAKGFVPYLIASALTAALHLWKRNALLSICSGTIIYMIFTKIL